MNTYISKGICESLLSIIAIYIRVSLEVENEET